MIGWFKTSPPSPPPSDDEIRRRGKTAVATAFRNAAKYPNSYLLTSHNTLDRAIRCSVSFLGLCRVSCTREDIEVLREMQARMLSLFFAREGFTEGLSFDDNTQLPDSIDAWNQITVFLDAVDRMRLG